MTLFKCSEHGQRGIEHTCKHVYEAFEKNITIDVAPIPDEFLGTIWLCSDCAKLYKELLKKDKTEEIYDSLEACCNLCFKEWQAGIGK